MKKLILSASRVKVFKQCPRKYYYTYIDKLPTKPKDFFDIGTLVHGVLEFFHNKYRSDKTPSKNPNSLMKVAFDKQHNSMSVKRGIEELPRPILEEAHAILTNYLKHIKTGGIGSEILFIESRFNLPLSERYNIMGFVDRIDRDQDGMYHIKDYKTSKSDKYMDGEQLLTYGIHLLNRFPNTDSFRASYIMLRHNKEISYNFNSADVEKEKKSLIECGQQIDNEKRWIEKPTKLCDWCDFKAACKLSW